MESNCITIKLNDDSTFSISKKAAELSELLKGAMNDYPNDTQIPIKEVEKKTIELVIEYLNHYEGKVPPEIEKPLSKGELKDILCKNTDDTFPFDFIDKLNLESVANLCVAANFMGINPLLDLCCAKIAYLCKDKEEDEILKTFGITETFTEEEKQKIREENSWIEENI